MQEPWKQAESVISKTEFIQVLFFKLMNPIFWFKISKDQYSLAPESCGTSVETGTPHDTLKTSL